MSDNSKTNCRDDGLGHLRLEPCVLATVTLFTETTSELRRAEMEAAKAKRASSAHLARTRADRPYGRPFDVIDTVLSAK